MNAWGKLLVCNGGSSELITLFTSTSDIFVLELKENPNKNNILSLTFTIKTDFIFNILK